MADDVTSLGIRTAIRFVDALNWSTGQYRFIDYCSENWPGWGQVGAEVPFTIDEVHARLFEFMELLEILPIASWDKNALEPRLQESLRKIRESAKFELALIEWPTSRDSGDRLEIVSTAVAAGLHRTFNGHSSYFQADHDLIVKVFEEGIVDWILREGRSGFRVRRCALDGKFFTPKIRTTARFCRDGCRFEFNNLRASGEFTCHDCKKQLKIDEFSGLGVVQSLSFSEVERDYCFVDRVSMDSILVDESWEADNKVINEHAICVTCARKNHKEWNAYVTSGSSKLSGG